MKRVILGGLLAAAGAASSASMAADDTGATYISALGTYTLLDDHRQSKDDFGFQVGVGHNFAPNWSGEFNGNNGTFKIPGTGVSQTLTGYSVDVLYKFLPDSVFRPYVLAGGGLLKDKIGGADRYLTYLAEAGAGVLTGIGSQTGSTRVQLRTEAKYRLEWANPGLYGPKDPSDLIFGVGLQVMFGAPVPAPVVAAAPPPPPVDGDDDGDGVPNSLDRCPNTPKGDMVDAYGCTIKDEIKLEGVNFATDSAELVPESDYVLSYAVATLKKHPNLVIEVHGHTDNKGSAQHNLILSRRRAESVMAYLKEHGVTNTMTAKGYGKDHPIADNATAEGRLQNRRVSLHVAGGN